MFPLWLLIPITGVLLIVSFFICRKIWKEQVSTLGFFGCTLYAMGLLVINYAVFPLDEWKDKNIWNGFLFWSLPIPMVFFLPVNNNISQKERLLGWITLGWIVLAMVMLDRCDDWALKFSKSVYLVKCLRSLFWTFVYVGIPLLAIAFRTAQFKDLALSFSVFKKEMKYFVLLFSGIIFLTWYASLDEHFAHYYPFFRSNDQTEQFIYELCYGLSFFGVEVFFRGYCTHALARKYHYHSILIMVMYYVLLHFGKPLPECISAMFGGLILGTLSLRTRAVWFGVAGHLTMAWGMDFWALKSTR